MADPAVIAIAKARLLGGLTGVAFLQTLNERSTLATASDRKYTSLEHNFSETERITLGQPAMYRESGSFYVVCQTPAGRGVVLANTLAETVRGLFFEYAVDHFRVLAAKSATIFEPDDGNWFTAKVPIEYQFDFFKS